MITLLGKIGAYVVITVGLVFGQVQAIDTAKELHSYAEGVITSNTYNTTLTGVVGGGDNEALTKILEKATKYDLIYVNIDSGGGYLNTYFIWANYVLDNDLQLTCTVDKGAMAASAAALFLELCTDKIIHDEADIMFHLPYVDKMNGYTTRNERYSWFFHAWTVKHLDLGDFLRKTGSLEKYLIGQDIWFTGKQYKYWKEV